MSNETLLKRVKINIRAINEEAQEIQEVARTTTCSTPQCKYLEPSLRFTENLELLNKNITELEKNISPENK